MQLNVTQERLTSSINALTKSIEANNKTIAELELQLNASASERAEQHAAFRKAVKDQEATQKLLAQAIATLENYYNKQALVQVAAVDKPHHQDAKTSSAPKKIL